MAMDAESIAKVPDGVPLRLMARLRNRGDRQWHDVGMFTRVGRGWIVSLDLLACAPAWYGAVDSNPGAFVHATDEITFATVVGGCRIVEIARGRITRSVAMASMRLARASARLREDAADARAILDFIVQA